MTSTTRELIERLESLPSERQESWAQTWLRDLSTEEIEDEIASGRRPVPPKLQALLDEADADIVAGRVRPLDEILG